MNFPTYCIVPLPNTQQFTTVTNVLKYDRDLLRTSATVPKTEAVQGACGFPIVKKT